MTKNISKSIDRYLNKRRYGLAQKFILQQLRKEPKDHWLLTRLSSVYVEWKKDTKALRASKRAFKLAPNCPLVLWDYANVLDLKGRRREAIKFWKKLIKIGHSRITKGECSEGIKWSKSLVNDCLYRVGYSLAKLGQERQGIHYIKQHLKNRTQGVPSIYTKSFVKKRLSEILKTKN